MYKLVLILIIPFGFFQSYSQDYRDWTFDIENDTLVKLEETVFITFKNTISRSQLLNAQCFETNLEDLNVISFTMTSFTLGKQLHLESNSNMLTISMKNAIKNRDIKYKFVNFKDFVLADEKGNIYQPSLSKIKLVFID